MTRSAIIIVISTVAGALLPAVQLRAGEEGGLLDVLVKTVDADAVIGRLVSFSLEDGLTLDEPGRQEHRRIPAEDLVRISTHSSAKAPASGVVSLTLAGGDRLVGIPGRFDNESVEFAVPALGVVPVPLEQIQIWKNPQSSELQWQSALERLASRTTNDADPDEATLDRLLLNNGDLVRGIITQVDSEAFTLETPAGPARIAQQRVIAAIIIPISLPEKQRSGARLYLDTGTRLTARSVKWTGISLTVEVLDGVKREITADHLLHLDVLGGRWRWLTELTPMSVEQVPMLSLDWPHRVDRNVLGGPLKVKGQAFEHGIGVHSRSVLAYSLRRTYRQFVTAYGIDDDSGPYADVSVTIRVDDRTVHTRNSLQPGTFVGPLRFDVTGADRLELIVDFGRRGGIQDRFDWIESALIR